MTTQPREIDPEAEYLRNCAQHLDRDDGIGPSGQGLRRCAEVVEKRLQELANLRECVLAGDEVAARYAIMRGRTLGGPSHALDKWNAARKKVNLP